MTLQFFWTYLEIQLGQNYWYEQSFCLVFTAPAKWRVELRTKIGHYRIRWFVIRSVTDIRRTQSRFVKCVGGSTPTHFTSLLWARSTSETDLKTNLIHWVDVTYFSQLSDFQISNRAIFSLVGPCLRLLLIHWHQISSYICEIAHITF